jgi:hypothetical protein
VELNGRTGYGSKEKLFAAAAEFDLRLPDPSTLPPDRVGAVLVRHFVDRWESDETLTALLRAGVTNSAAVDRMREIFSDQLGSAVAALCADPAQVPLRSGLLATQVLGLALCRYVLRLPPVAAMTRDEVVAWLGPTVQRYLTGTPEPLPGGGTRGRTRGPE